MYLWGFWIKGSFIILFLGVGLWGWLKFVIGINFVNVELVVN